MDIILAKRFAPDSNVDEFDTRQIKKALNCLGYYMPHKNLGITGFPDAHVFDALKNFQKNHSLPATGRIAPYDETITALNDAIKKERPDRYIWCTVNDGKVRANHAAFEGMERSWAVSPDPGEDFNCRCWAEPTDDSETKRKQAILGKGQADFTLKPDLHPVSKAPWYSIDFLSEVAEYDALIVEEARKAKIDPDLIRAIVYVETTQGHYDRAAIVHDWTSELLHLNDKEWHKSIRPMNIRADYWKDLGYSRKNLENPRLNIRAGIALVKRIQYHMPNAKVEEVATIYNVLGAKRVTDYGARVARVLKEKPWLKEK